MSDKQCFPVTSPQRLNVGPEVKLIIYLDKESCNFVVLLLQRPFQKPHLRKAFRRHVMTGINARRGCTLDDILIRSSIGCSVSSAPVDNGGLKPQAVLELLTRFRHTVSDLGL